MTHIEIINCTDTVRDYLEMDALHREIHADVVAGRRPATALMIEYTPTFTAGRRTQPEDIPNSDVPVIEVDRGGSVTWHGPGQLVCYPIVPLPEPVDVVRFVRELEAAVMAVLARFGIDGERVEGRSGVWIRRPGEMDRKICAIGVRTAHNVTMHGLALNISPDLADFSRIIPCGLVDAGVTSMAELGVNTTLAEVVPLLAHELCATLTINERLQTCRPSLPSVTANCCA